MDKLEIETPLGPIWFWGQPRGLPTLLVITGAFARATTMDHFPRVFPNLDVLRMHLPGNHCPRLSATSMEAYVDALNFALEATVSAPLVILGMSTGALVALGVRVPNLIGMLLIEPPVLTEHLWPLAEGIDAVLDPEFMHAIFGIKDRRVREPRDYSGLLAGVCVPAHVLLGSAPLLPRRRFEKSPSLVDERSRALLAAHPQVAISIVEGAGHNIPVEAGPVFAQALMQLVGRL